jgi:hypothetical protein
MEGYGLDLKCPPKVMYLRLYPHFGAIQRWWNLQEVGLTGRKLSHEMYS